VIPAENGSISEISHRLSVLGSLFAFLE
jgi:hypothetical protein